MVSGFGKVMPHRAHVPVLEHLLIRK